MQNKNKVEIEKYISALEKESNYSKSFLYALQKLTSICRNQQKYLIEKDKLLIFLCSINRNKSIQIENLKKENSELRKKHSENLKKEISKLEKKFGVCTFGK